MSSSFQMFVRLLCKVVGFLVLHLSLLKTEEYQRKGGFEMERDPVVLPLHVLCLLFVYGKT